MAIKLIINLINLINQIWTF